jgi:hypothetical protein
VRSRVRGRGRVRGNTGEYREFGVSPGTTHGEARQEHGELVNKALESEMSEHLRYEPRDKSHVEPETVGMGIGRRREGGSFEPKLVGKAPAGL